MNKIYLIKYVSDLLQSFVSQSYDYIVSLENVLKNVESQKDRRNACKKFQMLVCALMEACELVENKVVLNSSKKRLLQRIKEFCEGKVIETHYSLFSDIEGKFKEENYQIIYDIYNKYCK